MNPPLRVPATQCAFCPTIMIFMRRLPHAEFAEWFCPACKSRRIRSLLSTERLESADWIERGPTDSKDRTMVSREVELEHVLSAEVRGDGEYGVVMLRRPGFYRPFSD